MKLVSIFIAVVAVGSTVASLSAAETRPIIPLWPQGAPGSEGRKNEPEKVDGDKVSNIHHPSLTVYQPAKDKATGTAVIVVPGGGHRFLVMNHEGYNVGEWLAGRGIAAFVLKHRLGRDAAAPEGQSPYQWDVHGLADGQRALRLVRHHAAEWAIDPAKVGILGFSAGGEIAFLTAMRAAPGEANAADPIDRMSARPDFQALIYPGKSGQIKPRPVRPRCFSPRVSMTAPTSRKASPTFTSCSKKPGSPLTFTFTPGPVMASDFGLRTHRPQGPGPCVSSNGSPIASC